MWTCFAGWMKWETSQTTWYHWFSRIVVTATFLELAWVYGAAADGVESHYNTGSALMGALYGVSGVVVMIMMLAAPLYAVTIARNQCLKLDKGFRLSVIAGLWLTFVLTVFVASYLASQHNHFVGGNLSDAEGGLLFGWARDGGDLRAAHFFALHAMQFILAAGLAAAWILAEGQRRLAVVGFSIILTALTLYVFAEAIAAKPFLDGLL